MLWIPALLALLAVVGLMKSPWGNLLSGERHKQIPFEATLWKNSGAETVNYGKRLRMIDDLMKRQKFTGMTRQQVTALLGPTEKNDYFPSWGMIYWLGPERALILSTTSEWLGFKFDANGRVREYRVIKDDKD
jgi:hypothetical protein